MSSSCRTDVGRSSSSLLVVGTVESCEFTHSPYVIRNYSQSRPHRSAPLSSLAGLRNFRNASNLHVNPKVTTRSVRLCYRVTEFTGRMRRQILSHFAGVDFKRTSRDGFSPTSNRILQSSRRHIGRGIRFRRWHSSHKEERTTKHLKVAGTDPGLTLS